MYHKYQIRKLPPSSLGIAKTWTCIWGNAAKTNKEADLLWRSFCCHRPMFLAPKFPVPFAPKLELACSTMKHTRELNGPGTTDIFERICLHLDFIQGLSKVELLLQKRVRSLGAGWERDRTMVAPMHTLLCYCTTLLLETWHLEAFLNGYNFHHSQGKVLQN